MRGYINTNRSHHVMPVPELTAALYRFARAHSSAQQRRIDLMRIFMLFIHRHLIYHIRAAAVTSSMAARAHMREKHAFPREYHHDIMTDMRGAARKSRRTTVSRHYYHQRVGPVRYHQQAIRFNIIYYRMDIYHL